jgi:hypothetical protein
MKSLKDALVLVTIWLAAIFVLQGCSERSNPAQPKPQVNVVPAANPASGLVLQPTDIVARFVSAVVAAPIMHSSSYAEVNYDWVDGFMDRYKSELFSKGVIDNVQTGSGWTTTFDCVYFVASFRVLAEEEYNKTQFNAINPAPALAIFEICYKRDTDVEYANSKGLVAEAHDICLLLTNKGSYFLDPQIGITTLSKTELESIFFKVG